MAQNDIKWVSPRTVNGAVDTFQVHAGTTASINEGEPVFLKGNVLGTRYVQAITASQALQPSVGTDWLVGISVSPSNETTTADGTVSVMPSASADIWLCAPKTLATWNTQAKYNAFVNGRCKFDVTGGVITVVAPAATNSIPTLGSSSGLVVAPLNITQTPGQVAFFFRGGLNYLA